MKTTGLRPGNLVYMRDVSYNFREHPRGNIEFKIHGVFHVPVTVETVTEEQINGQDASLFDPVWLTPEMLRHAGFDIIGPYTYGKHWPEGSMIIWDYTQVKLHEVQNIYNDKKYQATLSEIKKELKALPFNFNL